MLKKFFLSESTIVNLTLIFFIAVFIFLTIKTGASQASEENLFGYFAALALGSFKEFIFWLLVVFLFGLTIHFALFLIFSRQENKSTQSAPRKKIQKIILTLPNWFKDFAKITAPVALILFLISLSLGMANFINKTNLKDETLSKLDVQILGNYSFVSLHSVNYPGWFVKTVELSFFNLALIMIFASFYVFFKNKRLFREFASAISLSFLIAFPVWFFLPALSPQDRFIDNIYKLPLSAEMSRQLKNYRPQEEIVAIFKKERAYKAGMENMSTSTIPSAHVFWAVVLGYYLYRAKKWFAIIISPILILSSFGTVFFAQHYFVDIPAGILTAFAAIFLTTIYFNRIRQRIRS